jgi:hypothetical protein
MLYVQFDSEASDVASRKLPPGVIGLLRIRRLGDVFDGLKLRQVEPAVLFMKLAALSALGFGALDVRTWEERGADLERGFAVAIGSRNDKGSWPFGLAAFFRSQSELTHWLSTKIKNVTTAKGGMVTAGDSSLAPIASKEAAAPWSGSLASADPYAQLFWTFGSDRPRGSLWAAATRRGERFQVELVAQLPGLPPLHVIARDPPTGVEEVLPPPSQSLVKLRRSAEPDRRVPTSAGPPSWDEPGPCDCGVAPDLCAMKQFQLLGPGGLAASATPGADTFRQLSGSLIDLQVVKASRVDGIYPGDRILVSRSEESRANLRPEDPIVDRTGVIRPLGNNRSEPIGVVLEALPWPSWEGAGFNEIFSDFW